MKINLYRYCKDKIKKEKMIIIAVVITAVTTIPSDIESSRFFYYLVNFFILVSVSGLIFLLSRLKEKREQITIITPKSNLFDEIEVDKSKDYSDGVDIGSIVQYFLNLYRTQLNVSASVPSRYFRFASESKKGFQIYELRVFKNTDEWYTRRVTVGPIGVESGSRSNCFFATYDENIVVKIPPAPIHDFRKYCSRIEIDRRTASALEPIKSITPSISWVMNKALPQSDNEFLNAEQIESRYFHMLKTRTSIHDFLKIEGGFVYFMELSENYFMDQALRMIHDTEMHIRDEIRGYSQLVLDPQAFQGRYGAGFSELPYKMSHMFKEYESRIVFYSKEKGIQEALSSHLIKGAFYSRLTENEEYKKESGFSEEVINYWEQLLTAIFDESKQVVDEYFSVISDFVTNLRKKNLKPVFASLITNSVVLLLSLRDKKIAIRDIKPDNLFLDGKKDEFPQYLKKHERFEIGLIDLETAIDYGRGEILQPMLAGTPNYASPSHLFVNNINTTLYGDIGTVFFMQDWHAITAMIYRIITFEHLFSDTSRCIFEIQGAFAKKKENHDIDEYRKANSTYWKSALKEFTSKILRNHEYFSSINITITETAVSAFSTRCVEAINESLSFISELIDQQPYFSDKTKKNSILSSSSSDLEQGLLNNSFQFLKEENKWLYFNNASELIRFIILLKKRREWYSRIFESVKKFDKPVISAFELSVFMFGETIRFFDVETWKKSFLNGRFFRK